MSSPKGSSKNPAETAKHTECETPFEYRKFCNTILESAESCATFYFVVILSSMQA